MKTRQILAALSLAAMLLTSCAMFNSDSTTQTPSDAEQVQSSLVTLDHIYDGADELLGKPVGQSFILPEKLRKWTPEGLYKLHTSKAYSDDKQSNYDNLARAVKIMTGSEPEEQYLTYNEEYRRWEYDTPALSAYSHRSGVGVRIKEPDEKAPDLGDERPMEEDVIRENYDIQKGEDGVIKTSAGELRVSELAKSASEQYRDKLDELGAPFKFVPTDLSTQMIPKFGLENISVHFTNLYKGIPFFLCGNQDFPFERNENGDYDTYEFSPTIQMIQSLDYSDGKFYGNMGCGEITVTEQEEIREMIPFTKAVELLKSAFADYSNVQIIYAELNYCAPRRKKPKYMQGDTGIDPEWDAYHQKEAEEGIDWEPYWCFYFDQYKQGEALDCFKVNAVTGEIVPDLRPVGVR